MIGQNQRVTGDFCKWRFCVAPMLDWTDKAEKAKALQGFSHLQRLDVLPDVIPAIADR